MSRADFHRTKRRLARNITRKKLWCELLEERIMLDVEMASLIGDSLARADTDAIVSPTVQPAGVHSKWLYDTQDNSLRNHSLKRPAVSGPFTDDGFERIVLEDGKEANRTSSSHTVPHAGLSTHVGSVSMVWGGESRQVLPGSWVVHVSNQTGPMSDEAAFVGVPDLSETSLELTSKFGNGDWLQVEAPASYTAEMVASQLGRRAMVLSVQPVFADYSESTIPNDLYFPGQKTTLDRMDVTEAWGATGPDRYCIP